jgi:hypothetical protein
MKASYLHHHVVHDPIRRRRQACTLRPETEGINLRGIQPRHAQDAHPKGREEHEEKGHGHDAKFVLVTAPLVRDSQHDRDHDPTRAARRRRAYHHFSAAVPLDDEIREAREEQVVYAAGGGEDAGESFVDVEGVDEDVGHVVGCYIYAGYLVHGLHPGAEGHSAEDAGGTCRMLILFVQYWGGE